jgi:Fe-Mn family superoxide dismutase
MRNNNNMEEKMFKLPELNYPTNALEPYISQRTVEFHYLKHHKGYVDKLNDLIKGSKFADKSLEDIIRATHGKPEFSGIYNNAAQVWNHNFYWQSLTPNGSRPTENTLKHIAKDFGSYEDFILLLQGKAVNQFGSGWVWLALDEQNNLLVYSTANADNPLIFNHQPLLVIDVWEHGYYLDYQNRRGDYVKAVAENLLNWRNVDII